MIKVEKRLGSLYLLKVGIEKPPVRPQTYRGFVVAGMTNDYIRSLPLAPTSFFEEIDFAERHDICLGAIL